VTRHILLRILQLVPTLFLASIVIFAIIVQAPGDPAQITAGPEATPEQLAAERVRLGLDKPLPVRYAVWLSDVSRLNLGYSLLSKRPVVQMISEAFPQTIRLAVASLGLSILIGFPMGIYAAVRQNSRLDALVTGFSSVGLAVPSFWLGILLILLFSVRYHWLPPSGVGDPDQGPVYNLRYLVMPVATIAASNLAVFARFVRSAMIDALAADYVRTARAKGLGERAVINRHALKNAMVPVVTILGIQFGRLLGGAVVTEAVFAYSGIGRLSVLSILNRDYPVVQGTLMLVVCLFLLVNLAVDLTYGYLDPRVKFEEAR
jgi:ABC-type dipeptide/oligopeptide/nickel transport system permease component